MIVLWSSMSCSMDPREPLTKVVSGEYMSSFLIRFAALALIQEAIIFSQYPYKSPSIGFTNRIFHPNVDEASGSVCLDVINQTWSPMFDLINIFEVFLPQLLTYPNPADPLNGEAAALLLREPERYSQKVRDYVQRFGTAEAAEPMSEEESESDHDKTYDDDDDDDRPF
eukprot:c7777_g1_i2.p1 GENE.c7777_g1_i2~~c7777_g1_i2.p1  ORF type:complete len:169 (-),score=12.05 c7777_g1_i2:85-591(-)